MVKRIFRSQNGFAIVQGMLLAAAVAGMAYVGTKMMTDQKMAQKGVESRSRLEQLHSSIYSILQNKEHCTQTLFNAGVVTSVRRVTARSGVGQARAMTITSQPVLAISTAGSTTPVFTTKDYNPSAGVITYMSRSVTINNMELACEDTWCSLVDLKISYGKLDHQTDGKTGVGYGGKQLTKTIKLQIQTNSTNDFESCYAVTVGENESLIQDFCKELGADSDPNTDDTLFTWNAQTKKCEIVDLKCQTGEVFAGWDSNGIRRCHAIKDWMNLANVLDTSSVSCPKNSTSVKFVISAAGKAQIQCSGVAAPTTCPNVMATSPVANNCYREIAGKCGWRWNILDCQTGSCGLSDGTGCTIPTRTADPWLMGLSAMVCSNYALSSPNCSTMGL
jgi:hypothetical protein